MILIIFWKKGGTIQGGDITQRTLSKKIQYIHTSGCTYSGVKPNHWKSDLMLK